MQVLSLQTKEKVISKAAASPKLVEKDSLAIIMKASQVIRKDILEHGNSWQFSGKFSDYEPPPLTYILVSGQNPPDINPRTKTPLPKPPGQKPPRENLLTQNISYINKFLPCSCFILLDQLTYDFVLVDIAEQPLFDLALWNMYDQTIGDLLRTNNAVEGWHRRFQANVGAYHPNFGKFIDILKREQSLNYVNISQAQAGHQPEPQRRRYQDSNRRIKNIVQDNHNRDRLQYLRGLAHNISM